MKHPGHDFEVTPQSYKTAAQSVPPENAKSFD